MCDYNCNIVNDESMNEIITLVANDWYRNSESCHYTLPVAESEYLDYLITKDLPVEDRLIEVKYNL